VDFQYSAKAQDYLKRRGAFMDEHALELAKYT
jgi:hypothetical protein